MHLESIFFPIIFLLGASSLVAMTKAFQTLGRIQTKKEFNKRPNLYFFYFWIKRVFPKDEWDNLFFLISYSKHILRVFYATTAFLFLAHTFEHKPHIHDSRLFFTFSWLLLFIAIITICALLLDFIFRLVTTYKPTFFLRLTTPLSTFFLLLFSPINFLLLKIQKMLFKNRRKHAHANHPAKVKDKILEFVHESELSMMLDPLDRKLITSIASFRDRIVREIMIPRIDIFHLPINITVHEAAQKFVNEGYSRIPVYRDNVDNIIGVVLYKDVLNFYIECYEKNHVSPKDIPLENLITPILFTPESKKISLLLQEFRTKQIHIAIVVDEYGGTKGIVSFEDILEELVGEIADEYDTDEKILFMPINEGGWSVDAKMSILDIEKELGILMPHSPEYDTIGGYIFHKAGTIPSKGWKLHHDNFDLEIISSNERSIEKIHIIPLTDIIDEDED